MLELGIEQVGIFLRKVPKGAQNEEVKCMGGGKPPAKVKKYIVDFKSHQIAT